MSNFFQPQQLSVVVPVRNEQDNVESLIAEIQAALQPVIQHEIIYIDDGSTDDTYAKLKALQRQYSQLRIVRHAKSCGQSTAVRTGVKFAKFDWIATLDGDGQNNPADIPKLLSALTEGVELVSGNRRQSRRDTWIKRVSSVIANTVRANLLKDDTCLLYTSRCV